ncbi:hypothetical protein [Salinibius halmophilus]|uniref:hypothetical protein n=1 Tax=Salinibius halmophilus TaxID=1853216 RepID=UPI000E65FE92|nr:hypothetical protein [Salinibius halmophilus]
MTIAQIILLIFIFLELLNVVTLYVNPSSKLGNGIGVFQIWLIQKQDSDQRNSALSTYLVNWVAGVKLIFICLLLMIVVTGTNFQHKASLAILIITTASFYWRLFPSIKEMDKLGWIDPEGYSTTLGVMIAMFIALFLVGLIV